MSYGSKHGKTEHSGPRSSGRKDGWWGGGKILAKIYTKVIRRIRGKKEIKEWIDERD